MTHSRRFTPENHDTGKSYKLNDEDLVQMQTLASDILSMERGQSKAETGKEHLERSHRYGNRTRKQCRFSFRQRKDEVFGEEKRGRFTQL